MKVLTSQMSSVFWCQLLSIILVSKKKNKKLVVLSVALEYRRTVVGWKKKM